MPIARVTVASAGQHRYRLATRLTALTAGVVVALLMPQPSQAKPCSLPSQPSIVVSKMLDDLGELVDVKAEKGACSYVVRRKDGKLWTVDSSVVSLRRAFDRVAAQESPDAPSMAPRGTEPPRAISAPDPDRRPAAEPAPRAVAGARAADTTRSSPAGCRVPDHPAVVLSRDGVVLGDLVRVDATGGKCLYVLQREEAVQWAVDASASRLAPSR